MKIAIAPAPLLVFIAVLAGSIAGVALSLISRPAEADLRMAAVRDTMVQVQRLNNQPGTPGSLPSSAVCDADPTKETEAYKSTLAAAAARHKLKAKGLSVTELSAGDGQVTPLVIEWSGEGEYSSFVGALSDLAAERPALFIEALDIKPRGSRAEFELKGKVWCWTPAANRS